MNNELIILMYIYVFDHAGQLALHRAASTGSASIIRLLIAEGCNVNLADKVAHTFQKPHAPTRMTLTNQMSENIKDFSDRLKTMTAKGRQALLRLN